MSTNPREKQREYSRKYRIEHPEKARVHARNGKQKFYADHRIRKLCIECTNPVEKNKSRCSQCLARRQAKKLERIANGQCIDCSEIAVVGNRFCQRCYLKAVSRDHLGTVTRWHELLDLFEKQKGQCALSGRSLILGVDADLDHINPRSRGGTNDLSNLQWVLANINGFKSNMFEDEFFILIEDIYVTMKARIP
jgi:5-methylcytosine-specific restriction endonuclease McrA